MKIRMNTDNKGQAILELAIFGSMLIMILGVLIQYGMRYNFQQQVMQQAFRRALSKAASEPMKRAAYLLIRDRHISHPSHPFGIGSTTAVSSSASVVRDYQMHYEPDTEEEEAAIFVQINNDFFGRYKLPEEGEEEGFEVKPGYTQDTTLDATLSKRETQSDITTTDTVNWQNNLTRTIVYTPYGGSGTTEQQVTSGVSQNTSSTWNTPW